LLLPQLDLRCELLVVELIVLLEEGSRLSRHMRSLEEGLEGKSVIEGQRAAFAVLPQAESALALIAVGGLLRVSLGLALLAPLRWACKLHTELGTSTAAQGVIVSFLSLTVSLCLVGDNSNEVGKFLRLTTRWIREAGLASVLVGGV